MKAWQSVLAAILCVALGLWLILIFLGYVLNIPSKQPRAVPQEQQAPIARAIPAEEPPQSRGLPSAPITITAYMDFSCSHCKTMYGNIERLVTAYPQNIRVIWKDLFSDAPPARAAQTAARCAGEQEKFWEYAPLLFETSPDFSDNRLRALAQRVGLNLPVWSTCRERPDHGNFFTRMEDHAKQLGITATPTIFINDYRLQGLVDYSTLQQRIEQLLLP